MTGRISNGWTALYDKNKELEAQYDFIRKEYLKAMSDIERLRPVRCYVRATVVSSVFWGLVIAWFFFGGR